MKLFILLKHQHMKELVVVNANKINLNVQIYSQFRSHSPGIYDLEVHNASNIMLFSNPEISLLHATPA